MSSLEDMAEAYNSKTKYMPENWTSGVSGKKDEFRKAIAQLTGSTPGQIRDSRVNAWADEVAASADEYKSAIQDKGSKLAENFKKAFVA